MMGVRQPPARKLPNLTAARAGARARGARVSPRGRSRSRDDDGNSRAHRARLMHTLEDEGYLQRGHGTYRQRHTYSVTPRLLALAGQLAARGCRSSRAVSAPSVSSISRPASMRTSSSPATAT